MTSPAAFIQVQVTLYLLMVLPWLLLVLLSRSLAPALQLNLYWGQQAGQSQRMPLSETRVLPQCVPSGSAPLIRSITMLTICFFLFLTKQRYRLDLICC
jgi:hypothetical protein